MSPCPPPTGRHPGCTHPTQRCRASGPSSSRHTSTSISRHLFLECANTVWNFLVNYQAQETAGAAQPAPRMMARAVGGTTAAQIWYCSLSVPHKCWLSFCRHSPASLLRFSPLIPGLEEPQSPAETPGSSAPSSTVFLGTEKQVPVQLSHQSAGLLWSRHALRVQKRKKLIKFQSTGIHMPLTRYTMNWVGNAQPGNIPNTRHRLWEFLLHHCSVTTTTPPLW